MACVRNLGRVVLAAMCVALAVPSSPARQAAQQPPAPVTQKQIDAAIERGGQFLLTSYANRVTDKNLGVQERVGMSSLCLYALLKAGISKDDDTMRRLVAHIAAQPVEYTYDTSCTMLALYAHDEIANRRWIEDLAHKLIEWQTDDGDWSYPGSIPDLSNTQYAALGLWVAAKAGVKIDTDVWSRLTHAVLVYQEKNGGFGYQSLNNPGRGATGSMTAAGVGTLALCEIELRLADACPPALADKLVRARSRGAAWLTERFTISNNPMNGGWIYYYLYGLERLGAFTGIARLGDHDWYAEGAAALIAQQNEKGSWLSGTDLSDTCFAILFLRRATAGYRGPATGEDQNAADADSLVHVASSGDGAVHLWIERWNAKLVRTLEWPGERGRGPRIARVEYVSDDKLIAVQLGDPTRACGHERFDVTHIFDSVGKHKVQARVFLLAPNTKSGSEQILESQTIDIEVTRARPAWTAELTKNFGRNLTGDAKAKVKASSVVATKSAPLGLDYSAARVVDDCPGTAWLADPKDEQRALTITLTKGQECTVIRISPAVLPPFGPAYLSRPIELELQINGGDKHRLACDPDPLHPILFELERRTLVKRIDLRILSVASSADSPCVGIGEVELFALKK